MAETQDEIWYANSPVRIYPSGDPPLVLEGTGVGTLRRDRLTNAVLDWELRVDLADRQGWSLATSDVVQVELVPTGERQQLVCSGFAGRGVEDPQALILFGGEELPFEVSEDSIPTGELELTGYAPAVQPPGEDAGGVVASGEAVGLAYLVTNAERRQEALAAIDDAIDELDEMEKSEADQQIANVATYWLKKVRGYIADPVDGHELVVLRAQALASSRSLAEFASVASSAIGEQEERVRNTAVTTAVVVVITRAMNTVFETFGI